MADLKESLKAVGNGLRQAQNFMFSSKFDEAYGVLESVERDLAAATEIEAGHVQVKTYTNQVAKLRKDLDKRTGKVTQSGPLSTQQLPPKPQAPTSSSARPLPPRPGGAAAASERPLPPRPGGATGGEAPGLPAGVARRIEEILGQIAEGRVEAARDSLGALERVYAGQFDTSHPDFTQLPGLIEKAAGEKAAADASAAAARAEKEAGEEALRNLNQEWRSKFRGLTGFGYRTGNASELLEQRSRYEAARPVVEAFREAGEFEMEYDVEKASREMCEAVDAFPAFFATSKQEYLDACLAHIRSRFDQLDATIEGRPATMNDASLTSVRSFFDPYAPAFEAGGPEWAAIEEAMEALCAKNAGNRAARAETVVVRDDVYAGEDVADLKAWAEGLVKKRAGPPEILRTVVYKEDWDEKSGWEDYAGEKRFVTRRTIYSQVAAKESSGVLLHSVAITKERRTDGTWSPLSGNVMWSEEMLAENVG